VKYAEIDFERWDFCISQASNSLIYAKSWYLNIVSPGWEALISEDYAYVMPLAVKRKHGIPYLVQPILTQQLGVFSKKEIKEEILKRFIRKIPYLSYHLNLNEQNEYKKSFALPNYVLDLNNNFEELHSNFSKNTKRNIEKASKLGVGVVCDLTPDMFLEFYYLAEKGYSEPNKIITSKLIKTGFERKELMLYGAYNSKKELIAALCLLCSGKRLIYLLPVSNEQGKKCAAMFLIVSEIIRNNSRSFSLLDFEGSRLEGIARFYKGFGSENRAYFEIKRMSVNTINKIFK